MNYFEQEDKIKSTLLGRPDFSRTEAELRISKAGDCARLLDYELQKGQSPIEYGQAMRMLMGTKLHEMWQEIMLEAFPLDFINPEKELMIEIGGQTIKGHPDGEFDSLDAVYELKTVGMNTFTMIKNGDAPLPQHYEQANTYAGILGRGQILFHYFSKDSGESLFMFAPYSPELFDATKRKLHKRIANKALGLIDDRPHHDPTAAPCWYCPRKDECYLGYEKEVNSMDVGHRFSEEHDPDVFLLVKAIDKNRNTRLESDKAEKLFKSELTNHLMGMGISHAFVGSYNVSIKLGKNNNPLLTLKEGK